MRLSLLAIAAVLLVGCSKDEGSGLTSDQQQVADNLSAWAKDSGGDWNKLTPEQQKTLVQSTGSEATAKKVLEMKAHPPAPIAPGPPPGWKPGSAPANPSRN